MPKGSSPYSFFPFIYLFNKYLVGAYHMSSSVLILQLRKWAKTTTACPCSGLGVSASALVMSFSSKHHQMSVRWDLPNLDQISPRGTRPWMPGLQRKINYGFPALPGLCARENTARVMEWAPIFTIQTLWAQPRRRGGRFNCLAQHSFQLLTDFLLLHGVEPPKLKHFSDSQAVKVWGATWDLWSIYAHSRL